MRALVVHAHPSPDSYGAALRDAALAGLRRGGHDTRLIDLYADGFDPVMSVAEREAYHSDAPVLDPLVARYVDEVRAADALVFVYPTWWSGPPAMLLGWLQKVFVPGVAFVFNKDGKVRPGLGSVRRVVGVSTYGSSWLAVRAINDNGRRAIARALRLNTGIRTRVRWYAQYRMDSASEAERTAFLRTVEDGLVSL